MIRPHLLLCFMLFVLLPSACQKASTSSTEASAEGAASDETHASATTPSNDNAAAQAKTTTGPACDVELAVDGMSCAGCVSSITKSLELLDDVRQAKVDLEKQRAYVQAQGPLCQPEGAQPMLEAIGDLGYTATLRSVKKTL